MGHGARSGLGRTIPWLAVVVVSIFAFSQLRAHKEVRTDLDKAREDLRARESGQAPPAPALPTREPRHDAPPAGRERALDDALAREREVHAETRARIVTLERALATECERGDRLEALRVTEASRAGALAARLEALQERLRVLEQGNAALLAEGQARTDRFVAELESIGREIQALRVGAANLAVAGPLLRWLEDAASGEAARLAYAQACARKATPEQVDHLRALVGQEGGHALPAARLAGFLPKSRSSALLVGDIALRAPAAEVRPTLDTLGDAALSVPVLLRLLTEGGPELCRMVVARAAAKRDAWSDEERDGIGEALGFRLRATDPALIAGGAHGLGVLALGGHAPALAAHLDHSSPVVRAAAAHALSRVPDLAAARKPARSHLLPLLADADRNVRTAGVLLAERLLGKKLAFDPGAASKARAAALESLKTRLGG